MTAKDVTVSQLVTGQFEQRLDKPTKMKAIFGNMDERQADIDSGKNL